MGTTASSSDQIATTSRSETYPTPRFEVRLEPEDVDRLVSASLRYFIARYRDDPYVPVAEMKTVLSFYTPPRDYHDFINSLSSGRLGEDQGRFDY